MADELKFSGICCEAGYIAVTQRCNLECPHCYIDSGPDKPDMPLETAKKAIEKYVKNCRIKFNCADKRNQIRLSISGGEALIHPDITEILKYGKELDERTEYDIYSNGKILETDEGMELIKTLRKFGLREIRYTDGVYHPHVDIKKIPEKEKYLYPEIIPQYGFKEPSIKPIGRGKSFKEEKWFFWPISNCDSAGGCYREISDRKKTIDVVPYFVDFEGKLRYCCWFSGFLGTVDESMEKIKERFDNDKVYKLIRSETGLEKMFSIASILDSKYDYLPPNCARCHAITRDEELKEEMNLWLEIHDASEDEKRSRCPLL